MPSNPVSRVESPKAEKPKPSYYNEEQISSFLKTLENDEMKWQAFAYLLFLTCLRKGEALGLEWGDINFEERILSVQKISIYAKATGIIDKSPKTETFQRTIVMPAALIQILNQYKTRQNEKRLKLASLWKKSDRVFVAWNGGPMLPDSPAR
jgi:integrase